ncbi:right-handed parallel beta-helix repeat-containing protein [Pontiella sulfatireligans]|uniref:Right handed beta helix domain-containing protein n=1 Tax=Pontiella sulfatireligans TaxID=2750658 RepID=A0A6C2UJN2_9BACT|nr:right-handed parallel beta-helix repeat-containing protein [Pontiella sulfatireligans]VGO19621.1 hypothetical protein SCARR_01680 [Pontiella sulfatireligans]
MNSVLIICLFSAISAMADTVVEVSLEGKFQSLEAARNEVRRLKKSGEQPPFKVVVREGDYVMEKGLFLGKPDADLSFCAAPGETPRFFGGRIIDPVWFKPVADRDFLSRLVDRGAGKRIRVVDLKKHGITDYGMITRHGWSMEPEDRIPPASLNVGGQRMTLSRWPNKSEESPYMVYQHYLPEDRPLKGYELKVQAIIEKIKQPGDVTLAKVVDPGEKFRDGGEKGGTFEVAFDRMKYWNDIDNIFLDGVLGSTWEWTYNQLASVDVAKKQITLKYPELGGVAQGDSVRLPHFYFENIPEEIDQPGEYYIDRQKGLLYLYPPKERGVIVLSSLAEPMVSISNGRNIRFQGLELDTGRHLGFRISKSSHVVVDQCRIANFTGGGVEADGHNISIINSHIHGMGGFGVSLNGGNTTTLDPANNEVVNCHIHDFGWEQKSQLPGVMIDGVGQRVANCEIHDGPHFAIRVKGKNDILIENNEVYDLPKYHKLDGGSLYVYTGPRAESRGIVIRGNYFHDIPTIGVYPDNFAWGVEISHNLFRNVGVKTGRPPINCNGGGECRTFNNMMVDCISLYQQGARPKDERWFVSWNRTLEKFGDGKVEDTPYRKYDDFKEWLKKEDQDDFFRPRSDIWNNVLYHPNHEVYVDPSSLKMKKGVLNRKKTEAGVTDHSGKLHSRNNWVTIEDPGFVDYASGDFNLRADAPVYSTVKDFEPIPFERMGLQEYPVQ